ncbi:MAG TPA: hypothetical protein VK541_04035 [Pedobacter sp.]|uniref:hypothetical protein n=1 Tax=Pedobacter sp. TaxID=1411316 RepID=UPI002B619149|nr:hypothetical protein [Pedobacter sp.]HMI01624.1 hypothetical protein [Pedobacter sp.]
MGVDVTQRNATRNQSTADYELKKIFIFDNRFVEGVYKNTTGSQLTLVSGMLVARAAGTYEEASVVFSATPLAAGETVILGGLTYTSTGATTTAQLAAAFANLDAGATTGGGTATGTYSGALTGFSSGPVTNGNTVVFTATATGNTTNLAQTGTGAASTITITPGGTAVASGVIPVTSGNLANVIGVAAIDGSVVLENSESANMNYGTKGTIDGNSLVLPAGVTLDTIVGAKTLRDVIESLGLHVDTSTVDHTKFDN